MDKKQRKAFLDAVKEMGSENGVSSDVILTAIQDSFQIAFTKKLDEEYNVFKTRTKSSANKVKLNDALVRCSVNMDTGDIKVFQQFKVVEDEDIEDDFIEKGISEVKTLDKKLKVGDYYEVPIDFDRFGKADVNRFVSAFKQKITAAEKENLLKLFSGRIGELVTGTVEKADRASVIVSLGRTSVTLLPRDLIGKETFKVGDNIKIFIEGIGKDDKKGSLIKCSRSCPGFIRKLFESEVHEIYDQTVIIKDVARISGVRSKIAVYSNDPNVDASGACIGQNGSRIQTIVSQLGNSKETKEKIDVITYHENLGLFLEECLKPGILLGAVIDEENSSATCVVQNDTGSLAIGSRGQNVILARQLTHLKTINIIEESQARDEGLDYKTIEEFTIEAREEEKRKNREAAIKNLATEDVKKSDVLITDVTENFIDKDEYDDDEIIDSIDTEEIVEEETPVVNEPVVEETKETVETVETIEEPAVEVKVKPAPVYEQTEVTTTTTIESLEKSLEEEKKKEQGRNEHRSKKRKETKSETSADDVIEETKPAKEKMAIYTEEELEEFDDEYDDNFDDEDYSEYDSDDYYEN